MTREHLYKAKRKDWKELPEEEWWVEGYLYQNLVKAFIIFPHTGKARNGLFKTDVNTVFSAYTREVEPDTVCECTQMTDENNSKIFEGDIVRTLICIDDHNEPLYEYGKIIYDANNAAFLISCDTECLLEIRIWGNIEIIGNIFDNIELLKRGGVE